jgi:hypothetical protein
MPHGALAAPDIDAESDAPARFGHSAVNDAGSPGPLNAHRSETAGVGDGCRCDSNKCAVRLFTVHISVASLRAPPKGVPVQEPGRFSQSRRKSAGAGAGTQVACERIDARSNASRSVCSDSSIAVCGAGGTSNSSAPLSSHRVRFAAARRSHKQDDVLQHAARRSHAGRLRPDRVR